MRAIPERAAGLPPPMGKVIPMSRQRRTYRNQNTRHGDPMAASEPGSQPSTEPKKKTHWLKWSLTIAAGAIVGAVATDFYRRVVRRNPAPSDPEESKPQQFGMMGALPGVPNVMPMPLPFPMPMPMPGYGHPAPAPQSNELTQAQLLELARLRAKEAEAEAHLKAWEEGEID